MVELGRADVDSGTDLAGSRRPRLGPRAVAGGWPELGLTLDAVPERRGVPQDGDGLAGLEGPPLPLVFGEGVAEAEDTLLLCWFRRSPA